MTTIVFVQFPPFLPSSFPLVRADSSFSSLYSPPTTFRANTARSTPQERAWAQEVSYSGERELAWVLRWGMSRVLRVRGVGEEKRGLVDFEIYEDWRGRERSEFIPLCRRGGAEEGCPGVLRVRVES